MHEEFVLHDKTAVYYTSPLFDSFSVPHAFFTRHGGVSDPPFDTLNFAVGLGDNRDSEEKVRRNHDIAASVFGLTGASVCRTWQTHSDTVELAGGIEDFGRGVTAPAYDHPVDGLVTARRGLLLSVRTADCVPVLLYDPSSNICAAVHSGWRGTYKRISSVAIDKMVAAGASRGSIIAAVGPCAGACCYEVGAELYESFTALSHDYSRFFVPVGEKYRLDLSGLNAAVLSESGVSGGRISECRICTCCNTDMFFSHRVSGNDRGTMASFIKARE